MQGALGGKVGPTGITNSKDMVTQLTDKLYDFAVWYAATRRVPSGELLGPAATKACTHMRGAAQEVATVLVATLSRCSIHGSSPIQAAAPCPAPSPPTPCKSTLLDAASTNPSAVSKQLEEWRKDLGNCFNDRASCQPWTAIGLITL